MSSVTKYYQHITFKTVKKVYTVFESIRSQPEPLILPHFVDSIDCLADICLPQKGETFKFVCCNHVSGSIDVPCLTLKWDNYNIH